MPTKSADSQSQRGFAWQPLIEVALVFCVFGLHGGWPAPDVNEAHYLVKAKHYWNPDWCANDFFLQSKDAHLVFYWTLGWLTRFLSLTAMAWTGRVLCWGLMAWTFRRLSWSLVPRHWFAPLAAVLYMVLNESDQMAGEWVVGGLEAKGFSYALVFAGLEAIVVNRWNRAWLLLGLASAFHALVGGWAVLAAGVVWIFTPRNTRPTLVAMLPALAAGFVCSLAAVIPSLAMNWAVDAEVTQRANQIYVVERLYHHLDLDLFEKGFVTRHVTLGLVWLVLCTVTPATEGEKRTRLFVAATLVIAALGYAWTVLARYYPAFGYGLLRFYWFRMSDAFLPWGVATTGLSFVSWQLQTRPPIARWWLTALAAVAVCDLTFQTSQIVAAKPRADKNVSYADWLDVCDWVNRNTPVDAVFLTPRNAATFKWRAERAEIVNWKDVPQDAEHLVEWMNRHIDIHQRPNWTPTFRWRDSPGDEGIERLNRIGEKYQAQFAILEKFPGITLPDTQSVYQSKKYIVYRLGNDAAK